MSDIALPMPAANPDRRTLTRLALASTAVAALAGTGLVTPVPWEGPTLALDSVRRTVTALAAGYEAFDPRKTRLALAGAERSVSAVLGAGGLGAGHLEKAKGVFAQLLLLSANAADDTGDPAAAVSVGQLAASLAVELGDAQTAGHAWAVVSSALKNAGRDAAAITAARRGRTHAGSTPSAVKALLEEACAAAAMGHAHAVLDTVGAAEEEHRRLPVDMWGTPGFSLGHYHRADLLAFAGWALARVGLHDEALPRLAEASDIMAASPAPGLLVFARLAEARALLGTGDADGAHDIAAVAVAAADARPASWVAGSVAALDAAARGAFADLAEQTSRWEFAA